MPPLPHRSASPLLLHILLLLLTFSVAHSSLIPRNVFLYWASSWNASTPWLVTLVKQTWMHHNPAWTIHLIDDDNVGRFVDLRGYPSRLPAPAKSDIIRLNLLAKHGGVWADATVACLRPIDDYLPALFNGTDDLFWMYHGRDECRGPSSFLIISANTSYVIQRWLAQTTEYWQHHSKPHYYFWMDCLFKNLVDGDPAFRRKWQRTAFVCNEERGGSHWLGKHGQVFASARGNLYLADVKSNNPFVVKLSHHGHDNGDNITGTVAWHLLQWSLRKQPTTASPSSSSSWPSPPPSPLFYRNANYIGGHEHQCHFAKLHNTNYPMALF